MAEDITRTARDSETRTAAERKKEWTPPQTLPTPDDRDGWHFRWIRTSMVGTPDPTNVSAKFREGWEPCKATDHPELALQSDPASRFKGNIEIGGLMLCRIPAEFMQQRKSYYANLTEAQTKSVDQNFMREQDARMPLFSEKRTTTSFGSGNK